MLPICGFQKLSMVDIPGKVGCTVFISGCNLKCKYCYNTSVVNNTTGESYTIDQIIDYLKSKTGKIDAICITGGEPLLHFSKLARLLIELREEVPGIYIKLDTNGMNLNRLKVLIEDKLLDFVALDIKCGSHKFEQLTGVYSSMPYLTANYLMGSNDIDYEFRTTVIGGFHTDEDFHDIIDIVCHNNKYIEDNNIRTLTPKRYAIQAYDPSKMESPIDGWYKPSTEEINHFSDILRPYVKELVLRV